MQSVSIQCLLRCKNKRTKEQLLQPNDFFPLFLQACASQIHQKGLLSERSPWLPLLLNGSHQPWEHYQFRRGLEHFSTPHGGTLPSIQKRELLMANQT